ncbi:hypothetical protein QVD17_14938 [Tagetes erecta]|uniref:Uncharacterized protein n=1 Tax=Tagetes erecta TaxID=13708 RepID=A0AAD8KNV5_TARER|nr:hypothetical protein QVD17_14938 [Tagetes erecta]
MEDQTNFLLDWSYFCRGKSTEELTESLLLTTIELESARLKAQEQLKMKDHELIQLKHLLNTAINEKNEAQNRYQTLLQYHNRNTEHEHEHEQEHEQHVTNCGLSSSDCDESIVSSSISEPTVRITEEEFGFPVKVLPEKGKLLEAVMKAGPLLQNLLLAGPLPHWRHPPPPLEAYQIPAPPVLIPPTAPVNELVWKFNKKRGNVEGSDTSIETKYQRMSYEL